MNKIIKATLRIPTKHQYAYIEVQVEGEPKDVIEQYLELTRLYKKLQKEEDDLPF